MQPQQPRHRIGRQIPLQPITELTDDALAMTLVSHVNGYNNAQKLLPLGLVAQPDDLDNLRGRLQAVHACATDAAARARGRDLAVLTTLLTEVAEQDAVVDDLRVLAALPAERPAPMLHFCWSGGPIRAAALDNIVAWAERARKAGWSVTVWTDAEVRDWAAAKPVLKTAGVRLADIDKKVVDPGLWQAYQAVVRGPKPNFPAGSDLTRYSVLNRLGGVYLDVDISPGNLDTLKTLTAPLPLILLGPGIRDTRELAEVGGEDAVTPPLVAQLAALRLRRTEYNNNFIACPPGTPVMKSLITKLAAMDVSALLDLPSNAAFMTGPGVVKQVLIQHVAAAAGISAGRAVDVVGLALSEVPPLGWLTAESDNQEH